jgi:hypothetical protein
MKCFHIICLNVSSKTSVGYMFTVPTRGSRVLSIGSPRTLQISDAFLPIERGKWLLFCYPVKHFTGKRRIPDVLCGQ